MNWIDMSDQDKLYNYAKDSAGANFDILSCHNNVDSYYLDSTDSKNVYDLSIMEYSVEEHAQFKKMLTELWDGAGFKNPEMLATIISTTALKNMPEKIESGVVQDKGNASQDKPTKKEAFESVNPENAPPVFVYEF